jgi:omega-amidase
METLKVTTIQADLIWENKTANLQKFDGILRGVTDTDVIVLPEMFTTGFSMQPEKWAEPLSGDTHNWLTIKALEKNAAIVGSFICSDGGQYYNRLIWVQPDGQYFTYDKRHLFTLAGEHKAYTEGVSRLTVEWRGWRICPLICYDLRFPMWSRNAAHFQPHHAPITAHGYYDILIYVANWPKPRIHHWQALLTARAIENQAYVVGVNRVGNDGNGVYHSGSSSIIDFYGKTLYQELDIEHIHTTIFYHTSMMEYRQKFGFLNDQDSILFNI